VAKKKDGEKGGKPVQAGSRKGKRSDKDQARTLLRKIKRTVKNRSFAQTRAIIKDNGVKLRSHYGREINAIEKNLPAPKPPKQKTPEKTPEPVTPEPVTSTS
jgi:hypothetical protein